ncbi:DUF721 domain-containing protein [Zavarzinia compransoris]|uniref:DUF721 domain-containing protein n=1 Tax=Zavarzinia compransoris TaxID=1264899 RepID=A0A317EA00_9PROT|nr:DciA family protein [Zavarzinia compransoris]PWR23531.1 DUF721 domain-containing protein [Zavarzinia compransoris]TDP47741.1 hypothetical protein DES42_10235 [Zavarzinia compransoris]
MVRSTKTFDPSPERRRRTEPASANLAALLRSVAGKRGFAAAEIVTHWPLIVGERLAACTLPERLRFERNANEGGVLEVRVDGPLALELQHLEPQIVEKVNGFCGYRAAARLKLTRGHVPPPAPRRGPLPPVPPAEKAAIDRMVAAIEDDHLREALASLGRAMRARAIADGGR